MNTTETNEIQNLYVEDWKKELEGKDFEDLARIIANKQNYDAGFVEMTEQKLKQHPDYNEMMLKVIIESENNKRREMEEEKGRRMSGWLQLFMAGLAIVSTITLYRSLKAISPETYGFNLPLMWSDITAAIGISVLAGYTFVALYKRWKNAIHMTRFYIIVCIILNLMFLLQLIDTTNPLENLSLFTAFGGMVVSILWWLYFSKSKRIKVRYPLEERRWLKRDRYVLGTIIAIPLILMIWGMFATPSINLSTVADDMDVTEVDQSSYLIDESILEDGEITDGIVIIKVPRGVEYEQIDLGDGDKCYDLSNKKENPDYMIRVIGQGYVETGDIVFENLWEQYQDSTMLAMPHEIIRNDVTDIENGKCYRKIIKFKSDIDIFWDFTLLWDLDYKKVCLLNSYYRKDKKAPIDELIAGIKFWQ